MFLGLIFERKIKPNNQPLAEKRLGWHSIILNYSVTIPKGSSLFSFCPFDRKRKKLSLCVLCLPRSSGRWYWGVSSEAGGEFYPCTSVKSTSTISFKRSRRWRAPQLEALEALATLGTVFPIFFPIISRISPIRSWHAALPISISSGPR